MDRTEEFEHADDGVDGGDTATVPVNMGDTESLLQRAIDMIERAGKAAMSGALKVDRKELTDILKDARDCLPVELREANWMIRERADFVAQTQRDADEVLAASRREAERLVQRTEVVRAAEARARDVLQSADERSKRIKMETEDFLDRRLGSFEVLLDRLTRQVAEGRHRLSIISKQPEASPVDAASAGLFDVEAEGGDVGDAEDGRQY
jgi:hypothetical protein